MFATRNGTVKKTVLSAYGNVRSVGINAINIEDGDELIDEDAAAGALGHGAAVPPCGGLLCCGVVPVGPGPGGPVRARGEPMLRAASTFPGGTRAIGEARRP